MHSKYNILLKKLQGWAPDILHEDSTLTPAESALVELVEEAFMKGELAWHFSGPAGHIGEICYELTKRVQAGLGTKRVVVTFIPIGADAGSLTITTLVKPPP